MIIFQKDKMELWCIYGIFKLQLCWFISSKYYNWSNDAKIFFLVSQFYECSLYYFLFFVMLEIAHNVENASYVLGLQFC